MGLAFYVTICSRKVRHLMCHLGLISLISWLKRMLDSSTLLIAWAWMFSKRR